MKVQRTFSGGYATTNATEWITNLQRCFDIKRLRMYDYEVKYGWGDERKRCKVMVTFE